MSLQRIFLFVYPNNAIWRLSNSPFQAVASANLPLNYRVLKTLTVGDTVSKREGGHEKVKEAKKIISIITSSVTAAPLPTIQLLLFSTLRERGDLVSDLQSEHETA